MGNVKETADDLGRQADKSDWLDHVVRMGLVTYGAVHLMIAWMAVQLATGDRSGSASSKGALQELSQQPFGMVLIWLVAVGMFLLVVWRLIEAAFGHREEDGATRVGKRLASLGMAVIYGSIAVSAINVASGSGSGGGGSDSTTAKLMDLPGGQWLVGLVGLVIGAIGANLIRVALTEQFAEQITAQGKSGDIGTAYLWFGKVGSIAKGIAFLVVGGLFGYAGITHEAKKSGGLDQALQKVLQQPFGQVMLVVIAVGIACFGLFCFIRARHLSR